MPKRYLLSLREDVVLSLLRRHFEIEGEHTFSDSADEDYVFVNYGFVVGD
jgi:hypothetical protein